MRSFLTNKIKNKLSFKNKNDNLFQTYSTYNLASKEGNTYVSKDLTRVIAAKGFNFKKTMEDNSEVNLNGLNDSKAIRTLIAIACSQNGESLSILDFGGGTGHHYFIAKKLLTEDIKVNWLIVETPELVNEIKKYDIENEELKFFASLSEATQYCDDFDVVYANVSLCYTENPNLDLKNLLKLNYKKVFITNHPLSKNKEHDIIGLQISDLKTNGVGREIPTELNIKNKEIKYPFTIQQELEFESIVKKYCSIVAKFKEVDEAYKTLDGNFNTYGYILSKKLNND